MVCGGLFKEKGKVVQSMAMGPERSKPLHNFTLPFLKWGNQRYLRCMKLESDGDEISYGDRRSPAVKFNSPEFSRLDSETGRPAFFKDPVKRLRGSKSKIERNNDNYEGDDGIEAVREKLMIDLKTAADKMKVAFLRNEVVEGEEDAGKKAGMAKPEKESPEVAPSSSSAELRPWSLRTRRTASKSPIDVGAGDGGASKALKIEKRLNRNSPLRSDGGVRSPRLRPGPEKKEREKFSVSLSKKEIEEDFVAMMGRRPPRRPKKRPRIVQNQMDTLFPGLWLTEITADIYEVPEIPENGKR